MGVIYSQIKQIEKNCILLSKNINSFSIENSSPRLEKNQLRRDFL